MMRLGYYNAVQATSRRFVDPAEWDYWIAGKPAAKALDAAGIELNYNTVPFDPRKPFDPSGIRLGTPAITTRGLTEEHMGQVAAWMDEVIQAARKGEDEALDRVASEIRELMRAFPMPGWAPTPSRRPRTGQGFRTSSGSADLES